MLVSVGANDVYFGPIVGFCIRERNCVDKPFDPEDPEQPAAGTQPLAQVAQAALARLADQYAELSARLAGVVAPERTLIVDYFDPTRDENGEFCRRIGFPDPFFGNGQIDRREAEWASTNLLGPLNREVEEAARTARWTEVTGVAEAFRTHGYCADESWIRHLVRSIFTQKGNRFFSRVAGALHPNEIGHRETALLLGGVLQRVLGQSEPTAAAGVTDDEVVVTVERPEEPSDSEGERDTEESALIALAIALVVGALIVVGGVLYTRSQYVPPEGFASESTDGARPPEPPEEAIEAYGAMIERPTAWVHRRVEQFEFCSQLVVRRRGSVDFTPGPIDGGPVPTHVPIALLEKGLLSAFDLRNEAGDSVPLLTREENAALSTAHMLRIAAEVTDEPIPADLADLCWDIAQGQPDEANDAIAEIATSLEPAQMREKLVASARFRSATETYANNFPLIIRVDGEKRRVIKFAYNETVEGEPTPRSKLGIDPVKVWFTVAELGDAASRHFEFMKSDGLDIFDVHLVGESPDGTYVASERTVEGDEAHLAVGNVQHGTPGVIRVKLRASRIGLLVGAPWLALLSALALSAAWFALPQLAGEDSASAASFLLAVPAALSAFLGTRRPHPLEGELLKGPRALVFVSGAAAFVGAAALALDPSLEPLRFILGGAAIVSWLPVVGLFLTWRLPERRLAGGA